MGVLISLWCPQEEGGRCINRYYFGQGYKQRFPQVEEVIVADYLEEALTSYNQTYYPLAIKIVYIYIYIHIYIYINDIKNDRRQYIP